jgi:hypothetical protein
MRVTAFADVLHWLRQEIRSPVGIVGLRRCIAVSLQPAFDDMQAQL